MGWDMRARAQPARDPAECPADVGSYPTRSGHLARSVKETAPYPAQPFADPAGTANENGYPNVNAYPLTPGAKSSFRSWSPALGRSTAV